MIHTWERLNPQLRIWAPFKKPFGSKFAYGFGLWVYYDKIPIYPIFSLLKGDYKRLVSVILNYRYPSSTLFPLCIWGLLITAEHLGKRALSFLRGYCH